MKTSITFFGTPEFAVPALQALIRARFCDIRLVVTQPDKPVGRRHSKLIPSPVKQIAHEHGIEVITQPPPRPLLNTGGGVPCQLGVLVAYGEIIPKELIDAFPLGILNIHPSLLPTYRGSSPIQAAILNQDRETGVTLMKLDDRMDHGPILAQERVKLAMTETAGELHDKLAQIGAELLIKTLPDYIAGRIKPKPQDDSQASYTKKLTKQDGRIDWSKSPGEISAHVRAMNPWPGAWTEWKGKKLIIWKVSLAPPRTSDSEVRDPVYALNTRKGSLANARDDSMLQLQEVQLEGKAKIPYKAFLKGRLDFEMKDCC